jgi:hypothetical protein
MACKAAACQAAADKLLLMQGLRECIIVTCTLKKHRAELPALTLKLVTAPRS